VSNLVHVACILLVGWIGLRTADAAAPHHLRFKTAHGPVHVWSPANYDQDTAGIVVYVHGYFTNVDRAWRQHRLPEQFAASSINALFIACDAPDGIRDNVKWESIEDLLAVTKEHLPDGLPTGRVVVVGHSGAHRTISSWLDEDRIDTIVLVDALYGEPEKFHAWLEASPERRLIDAAVLTRPWSDALHATLPDTLVFRKFPPARTGRLEGARKARVVYVHSQHDHMRLVTGGIALPMLLRAVTLPTVAHASRRAPIRVR
jgi:hypothetical protein